jgi:hypothetical protein
VPKLILGEIALWCLYLATKPSHMGGDMDGLAYSLHWPTVHSCQPMGQNLPVMRRLVLSLQKAVVPVGRRGASRASISNGELTAWVPALLHMVNHS